MNPIERQPQFETGPEIMKLPEISIREERGATLLSILFRGYKRDWGSHEHELSQKVDEFF